METTNEEKLLTEDGEMHYSFTELIDKLIDVALTGKVSTLFTSVPFAKGFCSHILEKIKQKNITYTVFECRHLADWDDIRLEIERSNAECVVLDDVNELSDKNKTALLSIISTAGKYFLALTKLDADDFDAINGEVSKRFMVVSAQGFDINPLLPLPEQKKMKYILTLENGETRDVQILRYPHYKTLFHGDASAKYCTAPEIKEAGNRILEVDYSDVFTLYGHGGGYILDEGAMFSIYKLMRNQIVKLEKVSDGK